MAYRISEVTPFALRLLDSMSIGSANVKSVTLNLDAVEQPTITVVFHVGIATTDLLNTARQAVPE